MKLTWQNLFAIVAGGLAIVSLFAGPALVLLAVAIFLLAVLHLAS